MFLQKNVIIGRMPIMLRSCCCVLYGKDEAQLAELGLYPHTLMFSCFLPLLLCSYFYVLLLLVYDCFFPCCCSLQVSAPLILEDILSSKGQRRCYSDSHISMLSNVGDKLESTSMENFENCCWNCWIYYCW